MLSVLARCAPCFSAIVLLSSVLLHVPLSAAKPIEELAEHYLSRWSAFYPTRAFAEGRLESAAYFEDYSEDTLSRWRKFNVEVRQALERSRQPGLASSVDARILQRQVTGELFHWREERPLQTRPEWYASQISQALTHLLVNDTLPLAVKRDAVLARLGGVRRLCEQGQRELRAGNRLRSESAIRSLRASAAFYRDRLPGLLLADSAEHEIEGELQQAGADTAVAVLALSRHIAREVLPVAGDSAAMGAERYAALLSHRSDGRLAPEELAARALAEVERVRSLMLQVAVQWWRQSRSGSEPMPADAEVLALALAAMEKERAATQPEFLQQFTELTRAAEQFIRRKQLATVPEPTTLFIASSPQHFAGAAVGGVYPAGPYNPQSDTLFYLPSIPEDAEPEVAEGFYRSFNRHFNTMIISHEMFPGHYMQYKVAVTHAPPIRSIFADGAYVEGWGSFSERLMLEAGWGGNDPLTWLAHYRKRLENATRSYVSVMVHTRGWDEAKVSRFAVEKGLLAPQFAVNLWQRVVHSPLQLTDYFVGYQQFQALWREQRSRLGEAFDQRALIDDVLRVGPVPVPELSSMFTTDSAHGNGTEGKSPE